MLSRDAAESYAAMFKVLADVTRVRIVSLLAGAGRPMTVSEITVAVGGAPATVSHHLRALGSAGFVVAEQDGATRLHRIDDEFVRQLPSAADIVMGRLS